MPHNKWYFNVSEIAAGVHGNGKDVHQKRTEEKRDIPTREGTTRFGLVFAYLLKVHCRQRKKNA